MKKLIVLVGLLLMLAAPVAAQTDPCVAVPAGTTFTVTRGAPFTAAWVMDAKVPVSDTDSTLVNARIDGFYLQIDTGARQRVVLPLPTVACPNGQLPFSWRSPSGVSRGSHTFKITAFNFVLNPDGTPTTVEQESAAVSVPFAAVDLVRVGPPSPAKNVIIKRN